MHSDFFFQEKLIANEIGILIRLVRSKDEFGLLSAERDPQYTVKIIDAVLQMRKVHILPAVAHAKVLEKANAKISNETCGI